MLYKSKGKVSRRAVSDAVAGQHYYNCDLAMVITNNYFQEGAIQLAKSTNCTLVDRDTLSEWIQQAQTGNSFFDILEDHEEEDNSNKIQLSNITDKTIVIEQIATRAHKYLYDKLRQYLSKGTQVIIIYPIIRTSYYLQMELVAFQQVFPKNRVAVIDENTSYDDVDKITQNFILGKIQILITRDITTNIQQTPMLCVIVVDDAAEFTEPELSKFCNVLANKSGKKYFCMLT